MRVLIRMNTIGRVNKDAFDSHPLDFVIMVTR